MVVTKQHKEFDVEKMRERNKNGGGSDQLVSRTSRVGEGLLKLLNLLMVRTLFCQAFPFSANN